MSRSQYWIATAVAAFALLLLLVNLYLVSGNRALQRDIAARQQFVQQSVQLEGLYREIVRALAELAARDNDADVRTMLERHGITYTVNAPPQAQPVQAPAAAARR